MSVKKGFTAQLLKRNGKTKKEVENRENDVGNRERGIRKLLKKGAT